MTKEQKEYIGMLADNYNQEVEKLYQYEIRLKNTLTDIEAAKKIALKTLDNKLDDFVSKIFEEQDREYYKKYEDMGISTDGILFKSTMFISKVILFFEKIMTKFKRKNTCNS